MYTLIYFRYINYICWGEAMNREYVVATVKRQKSCHIQLIDKTVDLQVDDPLFISLSRTTVTEEICTLCCLVYQTLK